MLIKLYEAAEHLLCHASRYNAPEVLTRAKHVVAYQFASGLNHKQIAKNLGISQNTLYAVILRMRTRSWMSTTRQHWQTYLLQSRHRKVRI